MLHHVHHRLPVTALAFWNEDVILAGEGGYLQIYDGTAKRTLASVPIFASQAIHGIISNDGPHLVVIWGGQWVRSLRIGPDFHVNLGPLLKAPDWILDGSFTISQQDDGAEQHITFVTAHNALVIVTTDALEAASDTDHAVLVPTTPGSNCILYTAHVKWLSASQCLIASGTAFGDVIVWSANISKEPGGHLEAVAQVHYTFSAHEGSVFGVQISSVLERMGGRRLLATCSDDRTVRMWDISDLSAQSPTLTDVQRDTGLGSKVQHDDHAPPYLAKAMGHMSRIWHVRFSNHHATSKSEQDVPRIQIMSFGEDASNIAWSLEYSPTCRAGAGEMMLRQIACQTAHAGKHIWSVAMSATGRLATGGCDGAIATRSRSSASETPVQVDLSSVVEDKDMVRSYDFVAENSMIAATESGRVLEVHIADDGNVTANICSEPLPELKHYSVTTAVPGAAFMAGSAGVILVYDQLSSAISEFAQIGGKKVAGLFTSVGGDLSSFSLLVSSLGCAQARLFADLNLAGRDWCLQPAEHKLLDLPSDFVVTSFAQFRDSEHTVLALGSRQGSIALYVMPAKISSEPLLIFEAHSKESITALRWSGGTYLHSIGRDGAHAIHRVTFVGRNYEVETVHKLMLPFGPNVEGMSIDSDRLLLWGFRGKQFVVYDAHCHGDIMTVECGGAHRSFAFQPRKGGGSFVWTKASKVHHQTQSELPYELFNSGWHGREVKSMAISSTNSQIIATGAEDTNIKLSVFDKTKGALRCLQTLRKHNTGIQHLQWSANGRYLFSSGGFEEFLVWQTSSDVPDIGLGVVCESMHPRSGKSDLRVMGFAIQDGRSAEATAEFRVTMAYSDSSIKLWEYDSKHWSLVATGDYLTACLSHATCLGDCGSALLTTSTDGHLALWNQNPIGQSMTWSSRHRIHQNAVLCIVNIKLSTDRYLFITGGDDNAIGITRITRSQSVKDTWRIPRAHAAAVTGIALLRQSHSRILLASASIDQKVKVWEITIDVGVGHDSINVKTLWSYHTAVADVSSLETCHFGDGEIGVVVCGVGMEVLSVQEGVKR